MTKEPRTKRVDVRFTEREYAALEAFSGRIPVGTQIYDSIMTILESHGFHPVNNDGSSMNSNRDQ